MKGKVSWTFLAAFLSLASLQTVDSRKNIYGSKQRADLHPLDPLLATEIDATTNILSTFRPGDWIFNYVTLQEPEKRLLLPYFLQNTDPPPLSIPRKSFSVIIDRATYAMYEAVVNLDMGQVERWTNLDLGTQPVFSHEESEMAHNILVANETVIARCAALGWTDMSLVYQDQWAVGYIGDIPDYRARPRLMQIYLYGMNFPEDNPFAHPFDFIAIVDLREGRVVQIEETPTHDDFDAGNKDGNIVPTQTHNFDPDLRPPDSFRDMNHVNVTQPGGPDFKLDGNVLTWHNFKMRLGFNGREGLVINHVNYNDSGTVRPLFYRMSVSEMFVPYGDPRPPYHRKHILDEGEFGVGLTANELIPQLDCVGEIRLLDAVLQDEHGSPTVYPRVICISEEDAGTLWYHTEYISGKTTAVRSQRLVLTTISTFGNYDYLFYWHFYMDGTIEYVAKLSGILSVHMLAVDSPTNQFTSRVAPQIVAPFHQHFFSLRIDAEVDGTANRAVVVDAVPLEEATGSAQNPYGQGFYAQATVLETASAARTQNDPEKMRTWHIQNTNSLHPVTQQPVAWRLTSTATPHLMAKYDSPIRTRGNWMDYNTWVTPYKEDQLFSGGYYSNGSGLVEWIREDPNANIVNTDIVLWHNFGLTHVPRAEDFPII